jgi:histidinol-phosphate aminotransferase
LLQVRKNILDLPSTTHGGKSYGEGLESGMHKIPIIDFSANGNPFGPPQGTRQVLRKADIVDYPDSNSTDLRRELSAHLGVRQGNILTGNGATEIIRIVTTAFINPGDSVLIPRPAYGEYETACRIMGARIRHLSSLRKRNFRLTARDIAEYVRRHNPKLLFLGSPNNPTGQYFSKEDIDCIIDSCRKTMLVLDEAYISFVENPWRSVDFIDRNNLIIVRSMTKDYALAGLRLGYLITNVELASVLHKLLPPWNVSSVAQLAGIHALKSSNFLPESRKKIDRAKSYLIRRLNSMGFNTVPSSANFFLVKVGNAPEYKSGLLRKHLLVRDCTSFGLPGHIRISPRNMADCKRFIKAMSEIKA